MFIIIQENSFNPAYEENSPTGSFAVDYFRCAYWFCDFYFGLSGLYWVHRAIILSSEDPSRMDQQGTVGKRKQVTLTFHQAREIIRKLESGESRRVVVISYSIRSLSICNIETGGPSTIIYGIKWNCGGPFQATATERGKISTIV
jgi:hypothetical protein